MFWVRLVDRTPVLNLEITIKYSKDFKISKTLIDFIFIAQTTRFPDTCWYQSIYFNNYNFKNAFEVCALLNGKALRIHDECLIR